jgi:hypothetical protein
METGITMADAIGRVTTGIGIMAAVDITAVARNMDMVALRMAAGIIMAAETVMVEGTVTAVATETITANN